MCEQRVFAEMENLNEKFMEAMRQLMCTPEFKKCKEISDEIWLGQKMQELERFADIEILGNPQPETYFDPDKYKEIGTKEWREELHKRATMRGEW